MEPFFIGQISLFAGDFAPRGMMYCNGQTLQISSNNSLFSIIGTMYGGDGRKTFGLPKLESPENGGKYIIAVQGSFPSRG